MSIGETRDPAKVALSAEVAAATAAWLAAKKPIKQVQSCTHYKPDVSGMRAMGEETWKTKQDREALARKRGGVKGGGRKGKRG